ncbi:MAG: Gx transporter family protein [Acutalibacteraceae bacterium]|nr:Gx transporter family protein [Acutalibacteraceae bacterium]HCA53992.1 heptaprenyl diphosphate synthase [Oscillospiraceae bacterium]
MKQSKKNNIRRMAVYAMLIALAMIFSYVESQVPPFFAVPGMKLGLTNIVVVTALYKLGNGSAMLINVLRIVLVSLLFGGVMSMLYSLAGGMLSTAVMIVLKKTGKFRVITVSAAGGIAHNVGQIMAAMFVLNTAAVGWYLAILWFTGLLTGILIGLLGSILVRRLPDRFFDGVRK